jgi:hypothetical protein
VAAQAEAVGLALLETQAAAAMAGLTAEEAEEVEPGLIPLETLALVAMEQMAS